MTSSYNKLRDRLMALDIDGAEQAAVDAVHNEYEQELVTEQQSIERLQDLIFVKLKFMKDQIQASANLAGSASNTPQGGLPLLAERQPPSPSEMPPSPPQSPPPAPCRDEWRHGRIRYRCTGSIAFRVLCAG